MISKTDVADVHVNGKAPPAPMAKPMSNFQQSYFKRLIGNFERAQEAVSHAQQSANEFVVACAEEQGIKLGQDGWTFDQEAFEFIRVPQSVPSAPAMGAGTEGKEGE